MPPWLWKAPYSNILHRIICGSFVAQDAGTYATYGRQTRLSGGHTVAKTNRWQVLATQFVRRQCPFLYAGNASKTGFKRTLEKIILHFEWSPPWHSIWHIFWHSIWHIFWHSFWLWHSIWHIFWHSIWHIFWHSFWHSSWHSPRWGPAVPSALWSSRLRSGSAHCNLKLPVEEKSYVEI